MMTKNLKNKIRATRGSLRAQGFPHSSLSKFEFNEDVAKVVPMLDPKDVVMLRGYFVENLSQRELAEVAGITQGAVSRRISQMMVRIEFLTKYRKIKKKDVLVYLLKVMGSPCRARILLSLIMDHSGNQTATAAALGVSQGGISRLLGVLKKSIEIYPPKQVDSFVKAYVRDFIKCYTTLTSVQSGRAMWTNVCKEGLDPSTYGDTTINPFQK